jgi:hypothetical protein
MVFMKFTLGQAILHDSPMRMISSAPFAPCLPMFVFWRKFYRLAIV